MPIEIVTTIEDKSGDQATTSIRVQDGTTKAQLASFAPAWATAINDVILGKIRSVLALVGVSIATITGNTADVDSDVEQVGKFQFRTSLGHKVLVNIPALSETAVSAYDSDTLDQSDTQVAAFIAAMESGITTPGGVMQPCDVGEESIAAVVFAREAFRNSGARR